MKPEDLMNMSDEDFSKLGDPTSLTEDTEIPDTDSEVVEPEDTSENISDSTDTELDEKEAAVEDEVTEEPTADSNDSDEDDEPKEEEGETVSDSADTEEPIEPDSDEVKEEAVDYESLYKQLMTPFKANGTMIEPQSPEDIINLAKMGANYHKKMQGIAPVRRMGQTLEKAGIDNDRLNFLIDLHSGNPEAIQTLLKEHKVDPVDIDTTADTKYTPGNHGVSAEETALNEVLDSIQHTESYGRTIKVLSEDWDETSRNVVANQPQMIPLINTHISDGTFDKVMTRVTSERALGRLIGISDLEAYRQVGMVMEKEGTLNPAPVTTTTTQSPVQAVAPNPTLNTPDPKEIARKDRRKAASPTRKGTKSVNKLPDGFNPLDLSDEEFEKFDPKLIGIKL